MTEFTVKSSGFARLNGVLGRSTPPIPYSWSGTDVLLQSGKFNQHAYLNAKFQTIAQRPTTLPISQQKATFERVIAENHDLLFDMHGCTYEMFQQYDAKFNLLLEAAFTREENEYSLRISKENIKNSLQTSDGWMNFSAVSSLVKLTSTNPAQPPDPRKFVPKYRR